MHDLEFGEIPNDPIEDPYVLEVLNKIMALQDRSSEECPHCGEQITHMIQHGRDVYAVPCGHRLWQGFVPAAWQPVGLEVPTTYAENETGPNTRLPAARGRNWLKLLRQFLGRCGRLIVKGRKRTV